MSVEREPIMRVWGKVLTGVEGQSPWSLNAFLYCNILKSRPICPEVCFFCKQKHFVERLGGYGSLWCLLDPPVVTHSRQSDVTLG